MYSDQIKSKSYVKLIKKYIFSEGEQFPLKKQPPPQVRVCGWKVTRRSVFVLVTRLLIFPFNPGIWAVEYWIVWMLKTYAEADPGFLMGEGPQVDWVAPSTPMGALSVIEQQTCDLGNFILFGSFEWKGDFSTPAHRWNVKNSENSALSHRLTSWPTFSIAAGQSLYT